MFSLDGAKPKLKAPFPWFGGKSLVSDLVWQHFGDVKNYVEPFFGSGAVLLGRYGYDPLLHTETVNDKDCFISNFWRALQTDPEQVAYWCDNPVNEADLHARHQWLVNQVEFREAIVTDPDFYDAKIAGWWVWGLCCWIGSGWCAGANKSRRGHPRGESKGVYRQRPDLGKNRGILIPRAVEDSALGNNGMGVHRKLPHLGDNGRGVHRKRPHLGDNGRGCKSDDLRLEQGDSASPTSTLGGQRYGCASQTSDLYEYFEALANRLRRVRVCCGDWTRVLGASPTEKIGVTGIFLDPPYDFDVRQKELYSVESNISNQVREWAIANGNNPKLRIALCGYENEHTMPDDWLCVPWKAAGGYGSQRRDKSNNNAAKERIWFSPHCLLSVHDTSEQISLFTL